MLQVALIGVNRGIETPDERQARRILAQLHANLSHRRTNTSAGDSSALAVPNVGDKSTLEADRADSVENHSW
jgi:hypothetical protein